MTLGKAFAIRLTEILNERKINLYKFAKDNCIARSTLVNLINENTKSPTLAIIYQVSDGLGMSPTEFLDHPIFKSEELEYL